MKVETTASSLRAAVARAKSEGKTIGLVPTMGNLHDGHLALVKETKLKADFVVVSVFVNPTQFAEGEDFDSYPRSMNHDLEKLVDADADLVFAPTVETMYPNYPQSTKVTVGPIASELCGESRPGHFDGVATVVVKLFNLVEPDIACFGEKDYQQLVVIRQVVAELNFPIEIVGVATHRAQSGLALSSRNAYLDSSQIEQAAALHQCLLQIGEKLINTKTELTKLVDEGRDFLTEKGFDVDYVSIKAPDLSEPGADSNEWVVLVAARLGKTRLIDNMTFTTK